MYRCTDCGKTFQNFKIFYDSESADNPPYIKKALCPHCDSEVVEEITVRHCRCCGARLPESKQEYCNSTCRRRGMLLWQREQQRRRERLTGPINLLVKELEQYNAEHGTGLSYGQYVALFKNDKERKKKCQ